MSVTGHPISVKQKSFCPAAPDGAEITLIPSCDFVLDPHEEDIVVDKQATKVKSSICLYV